MPLKSVGRDLQLGEEEKPPWEGQGAGGRCVTVVRPPAAGTPVPSAPVRPAGHPTLPANECA